MIIIRYNIEDLDTTTEVYRNLCEVLNDEQVIALPQDWDILFNYSTSDLYYYKEMIENAIHDKEIAEEY